ncbi:MAG: CooT family nickel-binding protein [Sedimentisphaerales bacterium]|jgi:predicted RNA-binding protein
MCLADIYQNGRAGKLLIKSVAYLKIDGNRIVTENLTGETNVMQAKIKEIDFMNSDIIVEEVAYEKDEGLKS